MICKNGPEKTRGAGAVLRVSDRRVPLPRPSAPSDLRVSGEPVPAAPAPAECGASVAALGTRTSEAMRRTRLSGGVTVLRDTAREGVVTFVVGVVPG